MCVYIESTQYVLYLLVASLWITCIVIHDPLLWVNVQWMGISSYGGCWRLRLSPFMVKRGLGWFGLPAHFSTGLLCRCSGLLCSQYVFSIWLRRALVIYFCLIDVQIEAKPADARPWHRPWFGLVRRMKVYTFSYGAIPFGYETAWNHALNTFRTKRLPSRWACQYLLTRGTFRIRDRPFQCVADVGRMIRFLAIHTKFRI